MLFGKKKDSQAVDVVESKDVELNSENVKSSWYRSPTFQVFLVAFTCFCCPGMFNALGGLGGGGQQDAKTADNGNVALYSTFAVFAFFGGTICNKLGPRLTLCLGSLGYALYTGSLLSTAINPSQSRQNFVIAAGAILGMCAGMLWTAEGCLMLAYATEKTKGRYIAIFWAVFNLGAVVGAAIPLGQNWSRTAGAVPNTTYIAFMVIGIVGAFIPLLLANPSTIRRSDGSKVVVPSSPTWKSELYGLFFALRHDPWVVLLLPFFISSNWFYTWQFNAYNGSGMFSIRARTLNNLCYWTAQIIGSAIIGFILDCNLSRRTRAYIGFGMVFTIMMAVMGGNYAVQKGYSRESIAADVAAGKSMDVYDAGYAGRVWLYIFNGILDATWQTYSYWCIGALSNDLRKLAYLTGLYKSLQSAGQAITFRRDAQKESYMTELASTWGLLAASLVVAAPMLYLRVQEHTVEVVTDDAGDVVVEKEAHLDHD